VNTLWPRVRLGDVLRFTPRPVTVDSTRTYREIGIRSHGRGIFHKPPVTGLDIGNKRVFYIEPDDFVLNIVFAWEGAVAVTSEAETGMIASHRFPTFRPDPARLEVKYLQYWLQTELGRDLLDRVSPGGAGRNRTLTRDAFLNQDIPLPPLAEQRRVVARIEELAGQIQEARGPCSLVVPAILAAHQTPSRSRRGTSETR
jgi:type I restriction enzyme, S subunit